MVALLVSGSAILLLSCSGKDGGSDVDMETMLSHQSDTLTMITSTNGEKQYRFYTPLMERYEFAREPYMEFRRGIDVITYDSVGGVKSTLIADYAIFLENQQLWEAKGNVVATNDQGQKLETQQLFWNQKTRRVYSNVDSKVTQPSGDVIVGEGFESDEEFNDWVFRRTKGKVLVDSESLEGDNKKDSVAPAPKPEPVVRPEPQREIPVPRRETAVDTSKGDPGAVRENISRGGPLDKK